MSIGPMLAISWSRASARAPYLVFRRFLSIDRSREGDDPDTAALGRLTRVAHRSSTGLALPNAICGLSLRTTIGLAGVLACIQNEAAQGPQNGEPHPLKV